MINSEEVMQVLVIDDEKDLRDGCERIIKKMNCKVVTASNGEEGIEIFKKEKPSIVLSDLKMPGIDGVEVLKRLREVDESVLVIIITGYATIETAIEAMKQGAYDFIAKPFEPDQLRIVVGRAIEKLKLRKQAEVLQLERLRTLADLGTEKSRIHAIIESLPNSVIVTNAQGNVVLMNPAFRKFFEISTDRATGGNIDSYVQDEGLCQQIYEISQGKHIGHAKVPTYEVTLPSEVYLLARGQSVLGDDNVSLGAVMIFTDITDLKNFDQLKSEFVAKVAHELRSPLSTIHEQLAFIAEDIMEDESKHILSRAKEKTRGLISFIGDLLDLSRIEAGNDYNNPKHVKVDHILDGIIDFLRSRSESKSQLLTITHEMSEMPYLVADPLSIESIFGNLLTNAIKYTPKGGEIQVHTDVQGKQIVVSVSDTGYGMDEHQQEMIFEKFYRVKNEKTRKIVGTGLGLSIVKGLVDAMEGEIIIKSTPDFGSTFTVLLPIAET